MEFGSLHIIVGSLGAIFALHRLAVVLRFVKQTTDALGHRRRVHYSAWKFGKLEHHSIVLTEDERPTIGRPKTKK